MGPARGRKSSSSLALGSLRGWGRHRGPFPVEHCGPSPGPWAAPDFGPVGAARPSCRTSRRVLPALFPRGLSLHLEGGSPA